MQLRIFLYKPGESIRQPLFNYFKELGHEVSVIDYPQVCLDYHSQEQSCSVKKICADLVIVGDASSPREGLSMFERRFNKGCLGVRNSAIIFDKLSDEERLSAEKLNCKLFQKPFEIEAVGMWLNEIMQKLDPERELSPFTIGGTAELVTAGSGE